MSDMSLPSRNVKRGYVALMEHFLAVQLPEVTARRGIVLLPCRLSRVLLLLRILKCP